MLVAVVSHSLDCNSAVAGRSLGCTARNFAAHTADVLHHTVAVAAGCSIVHTAVIDRNLHNAGMADQVEMS